MCGESFFLFVVLLNSKFTEMRKWGNDVHKLYISTSYGYGKGIVLSEATIIDKKALCHFICCFLLRFWSYMFFIWPFLLVLFFFLWNGVFIYFLNKYWENKRKWWKKFEKKLLIFYIRKLVFVGKFGSVYIL